MISMPDDGEASEESHGASNETQLGLRLDLLVRATTFPSEPPLKKFPFPS